MKTAARPPDHLEELMLKMNYWGMKWDLHVNVCPCDVHFNDWVEARGLAGKTIYNFGTGTHHIVGLRQAELGNCVFAITASKEEYDSYIALVTENARVAKSYLAYFGDIYLTNARLLPDLDVVTLFHLCEFFQENTTSAEYGGITDRALLDLLTDKTRVGGHILFYRGSNGYEATKPVVAAWERERKVERVEDFKTLLVYRKMA
jgi:hypothetical protein